MTPTTDTYFIAKAREVFHRAGGNPENSAALAAWAEGARAREDSKHGVLVAEDGTIVARTVWAQHDGAATYFIEDLLVDLGDAVRRQVGLTPTRSSGYRVNDVIPGLRRVLGLAIIEVRYWDVCTGAGAHIQEV